MSCPDCFSGTSHTGTPTGKFQTIHGIRTYVTASAAAPIPPSANPSSAVISSSTGTALPSTTTKQIFSTSSSTIILITDAFGLNLPNTLLLADTYASRTGFRVLIPDIIPGGGVPLHTLSLTNAVRAPSPASPWYDLPAKIFWCWNLARLLAIVTPFSMWSRNVFPTLLAWVRSIRAELDENSRNGRAKLGRPPNHSTLFRAQQHHGRREHHETDRCTFHSPPHLPRAIARSSFYREFLHVLEYGRRRTRCVSHPQKRG